MRVLRFIGKTIIVLFALFGVLVLAGLVSLGFAWRDLPRLTAAAPPAQAVLTFDLADGLVEMQSANPLATLSRKVTMRDLLRALQVAKGDDRVKGLVLRLGGGSLDLAHAEELADAVADFRKSGKFVMAFAESFDEEGGNGGSRYLLASAADQVWLQPSGELQMTGVALQTPFARDLLDKLGVVARMDRRKEFKGAINSFTENAMPAPQRQNMQALIDSWAGQIAEAVARNRHMDPARARQVTVGGPYDAAAAKAAGLIDGTRYWEEVLAAALQRAGGGARRYAVSDYIANLPDPPADARRIAVVYGVGPVVLGRGQDGLYGRQAMASTTVADALHAAVDDPKIDGIILRIDSPGGSYLAADAIWHEVARARQLKKPLVVSMAGVAASGGYFVAAPAAVIVAEPGTITGSIGVFGGKFVIHDLLAKLGVAFEGVASGPNALADSATADYTPEQWAKLEAELDRIYADFVGKVAAGRRLDRDAVEAAAKGQIWSGVDAKQRSLVDELGGFNTAVAALRRLAGISPETPVALQEYPAPSSTLVAALSQLTGDGAALSPAARLLQLAAPILAAVDSVSASPDEQRLRTPLP